MGAVVLAMISVSAQIMAMAAATGGSPSSQPVHTNMAAALIRSLQCAGSSAAPQACPAPSPVALAGADLHEHVVVPAGSAQCPNSGQGAACVSHPTSTDSGNSAVPEGQPKCPVDAAKAVSAPGSCKAQPATAAPATAPASPAAPGAPVGPIISPSNTTSAESLTLTVSNEAISAGSAVFLHAKSTVDVSGTPYAIEIFDMTTKTVVAACTETSECLVSFSAKSGLHTFEAFVSAPTSTIPASGVRITSNRVSVRFLGVSLAANDPWVVGPGKSVTFTATATEEVDKVGYRIEIHDAPSGALLTFCASGTTCSMSLVEPAGGVHTLIATLASQSPTSPSDVHAQSAPVAATWLAVELAASASPPSGAGVATLSANANADLSRTPYSIYFFDQSGAEVGSPCNAGTCTAAAPLVAGTAQSFIAVIARVHPVGAPRGALASVLTRVPVSISRLDVQAASAPIKPARTLWGVDSCRPLTNDPSGSTGLLPQVSSILGAPDFWGRYLPTTGNCPGLSSAEITAAHNHHIGILPIYNDYDCSAVVGNAAGASYATAAIKWLQNDLIPLGTTIAIDIEPDGAACPGAAGVDTGFIQGWYDVLTKAGYAPAYYGNTAPGSAFANAWCTTTQQRPDIASNAFLWSFEPSLTGNFSKNNAPAFSPFSTRCPGHYAAWQYMLSAGGTPDVDHDEAESNLPLWYP